MEYDLSVAVYGFAVHSNENFYAYCGAGPVEFRMIRVARSRMEPMDTWFSRQERA